MSQKEINFAALTERAFDGETYDPFLDFARLGRQMQWVIEAMRDGRWHTLTYLARISGGSEAGVSARLRDLRKARYGKQNIERERKANGLWQYRWNRDQPRSTQ